MIKFINNIGDYFSSNYFNDDFIKEVLNKSGFSVDHQKSINKQVSIIKDKFFKYKQSILEGRLRTKDKVSETCNFHKEVLKCLGYSRDSIEYSNLYHVDEKTVLPVRNIIYRDSQPHLMIMEMHTLVKIGEDEPDGLFEQQYHTEVDQQLDIPAQKYHRSQWSEIFTVPEGVHISPMVINKAVSTLFLLDSHRRPKYILLCAGNIYYLLEQEKWFRGSYLEIDLEMLFDEAVIKKDYYSLFYTLLSKETLSPKSDIVLMDQLDEESHKKAHEVTQDLKEGVIHAVEAIANEAILFLKKKDYNLLDIDADLLKNECLNYVYRLLFLFYAESRSDLDILPATDELYLHGYSLEMLRDLEQTPLNTASSQDGFFFHNTLNRLFSLLSSGYREKDNLNRSFKIRHLDSPLFNDSVLKILPKVKLRNIVWQDIICQLSLSKKNKNKSRGRISYSNLGINQLGSVYESLLAFRGFFAECDYIEVHRKPKKNNEKSSSIVHNDGSFLVPRSRIDDFDPKEVYRIDEEIKIIPKGTFIYRPSGRDRKKSASYYTSEVLTNCTVKYTLKPIVEKLDKGEMEALDLLKLKILEPAMGAAAFHNEAINQISELYLQYRQQEVLKSGFDKKRIEPDKYQEELQKVKAYIALRNVYGVDINPTAVELGKLSLWLNVIHKDMQTPFFGYRLGTGNAVVGSWLKVFDVIDIKQDSYDKKVKKEWWRKSPKHLKFKKDGQINRKNDEIYHFLVPDKGMVQSSGIKILKNKFERECKKVSDWRKVFCEPLTSLEIEQLQKICIKIDTLIDEHYLYQMKVTQETQSSISVFGGANLVTQSELDLNSYEEKEQIANQRTNHNAPYFKLKMVMDYWCSLWFWDVKAAADLPTREDWYADINYILNHELTGNETVKEMKDYRKQEQKEQITQELVDNAVKTSLFKNNRLSLVNKYAEKYKFFHYQLEFVEVFRDRDGFDIIVGNPPWVSIAMDEAGVLSEEHPEILIRDMSSPEIKKIAPTLVKNNKLLFSMYFNELTWATSTKSFLSAIQNYSLLSGQKNNLYKCILTNSLSIQNNSGFMGLIHPVGVFDDPQGSSLRTLIYKRIKYHFQFKNEKQLFKEIDHNNSFCINIFSGNESKVDFSAIHNLFDPKTIDSSFNHDGHGSCPGFSEINSATNKKEWIISPHKSRIINYTEKELKLSALVFQNTKKYSGAQLPSIHSVILLEVLKKISEFKTKLVDVQSFITVCWNQTISVDRGIIKEVNDFACIENYEMIYSGPQFYVSNPLYKAPKSVCTHNTHYDCILPDMLTESYIPKTLFKPSEEISRFVTRVQSNMSSDNSWIDDYKVGFSEMLNLKQERTLQCAIFPPRTSHILTIRSVQFKEVEHLIEFTGLCSSLILDYFVKAKGREHLAQSDLENLLLGIDDKYTNELYIRTLKLNCMTKYYSKLWEETWKDEYRMCSWSIIDERLKLFSNLSNNWTKESYSSNIFERRQCLIEIDVITCFALGLSLEDLIMVYNFQFPTLLMNEKNTFYDQKGNIVFTKAASLSGVGVNKAEWESINNLKAGETFVHIIEKSELYRGKKVTYYAPFEKYDRVESYKVAWKHFENIFGGSNE